MRAARTLACRIQDRGCVRLRAALAHAHLNPTKAHKVSRHATNTSFDACEKGGGGDSSGDCENDTRQSAAAADDDDDDDDDHDDK